MLFHTFQCKKLILSLCVASLLCTQTITAFAQPTDTEASDTAAVDYDTDAAMRLEEPIDSNAIDGWPTGPVVGAEGAILLEANTGTILYAKNIHEHLYPASTTKILTTLVAIENSSLSETVTYSRNAVTNLEIDPSKRFSTICALSPARYSSFVCFTATTAFSFSKMPA